MPRKPTSAPAAAVPPSAGDEILYVTILGGLPTDGEAAPPVVSPPAGPPPPAPLIADRRDQVRFYGLVDPRDGLFHYAGYTRQRLEARRRQHLADARSGRHGPRGDWLRDLLASGGEPEIQLLEELIDPVPHTVHTREQAWIAGLQAQGHPLTNVDVAPEPLAVVPFAPAPARSPARRVVRWGPLLAGALLTAALLVVVAVGGLPRPPVAPGTLDWGRLAGALPASSSPPGSDSASDAPGPAGNRPASTLTGVPDRAARTPPVGAPSSPVAGGSASAPTPGIAAPIPATSPPAATPSAAPRQVGSTSIQVRLDQSFAEVAAQLGLMPDQLAAYLGGRRQVYAGEEIVVPVYADPPLAGAPATGVPADLPARPPDGGPPPPTSARPPAAHPTYDDPAIASGGSLGDQEVGMMVPRYDDPGIRSGASIGGAPADPAGAPPATPSAAWATPGSASPTYDDPAITSGGSIGGAGP